MLKVYINREQLDIKYRTFGGGEPHIYVSNFPELDYFNEVEIFFYFSEIKEVFDLLLLDNVIKNNLIGKQYQKTLYCYYLPFSRQDRITDLSEPFSLKVICDLINSMQFNKVITLDNHSDVSSALLHNNIDLDSVEFIQKVLDNSSYQTICSPDAGALKKTYKLLSKLEGDYDLIRADKVRDLKTGEISNTTIYGECKHKDILIVDDICDGGRTYIELAKALFDNGANKVGLLVSHGIFSRGLEPLREAGISDIICVNNIMEMRNEQPL